MYSAAGRAAGRTASSGTDDGAAERRSGAPFTVCAAHVRAVLRSQTGEGWAERRKDHHLRVAGVRDVSGGREGIGWTEGLV